MAGVLWLDGEAADGADRLGCRVPQEHRETWTERVAIMVVDGGCPPAEAERCAWMGDHTPGAVRRRGSVEERSLHLQPVYDTIGVTRHATDERVADIQPALCAPHPHVFALHADPHKPMCARRSLPVCPPLDVDISVRSTPYHL